MIMTRLDGWSWWVNKWGLLTVLVSLCVLGRRASFVGFFFPGTWRHFRRHCRDVLEASCSLWRHLPRIAQWRRTISQQKISTLFHSKLMLLNFFSRRTHFIIVRLWSGYVWLIVMCVQELILSLNRLCNTFISWWWYSHLSFDLSSLMGCWQYDISYPCNWQ